MTQVVWEPAQFSIETPALPAKPQSGLSLESWSRPQAGWAARLKRFDECLAEILRADALAPADINRDDNPWHPAARLFRQTKTREYASVVDRVRDELLVRISSSDVEKPNSPVRRRQRG
jgi:hypothetical protein